MFIKIYVNLKTELSFLVDKTNTYYKKKLIQTKIYHYIIYQ